MVVGPGIGSAKIEERMIFALAEILRLKQAPAGRQFGAFAGSFAHISIACSRFCSGSGPHASAPDRSCNCVPSSITPP